MPTPIKKADKNLVNQRNSNFNSNSKAENNINKNLLFPVEDETLTINSSRQTSIRSVQNNSRTQSMKPKELGNVYNNLHNFNNMNNNLSKNNNLNLVNNQNRFNTIDHERNFHNVSKIK